MRRRIRLTESDLHRIVAKTVKRVLREANEFGGDYQIIRLDDFAQARQYMNYMDACCLEDEKMFYRYIDNGNLYICLRDGFEQEERIPSKEAPFDSYGLSMLLVFIQDNGYFLASSRWSDNSAPLSKSEVSQIIGQPIETAFT